MSKLTAFSLTNVKAWNRRHLHPESVVIADMYNPFDYLSSLVGIHGQFKASEIYDDPQNKIFHWINTMIGNIKKATHKT